MALDLPVDEPPVATSIRLASPVRWALIAAS
jgi:hypothetical protein